MVKIDDWSQKRPENRAQVAFTTRKALRVPSQRAFINWWWWTEPVFVVILGQVVDFHQPVRFPPPTVGRGGGNLAGW